VSGQHHAPAALYPGERAPGTHCTGGWVGPRVGLDAEVRGKILCLCRGSNTGRPVRSQTLYWLRNRTHGNNDYYDYYMQSVFIIWHFKISMASLLLKINVRNFNRSFYILRDFVILKHFLCDVSEDHELVQTHKNCLCPFARLSHISSNSLLIQKTVSLGGVKRTENSRRHCPCTANTRTARKVKGFDNEHFLTVVYDAILLLTLVFHRQQIIFPSLQICLWEFHTTALIIKKVYRF
jgi:hypothetical protein